MSTTHDLAQDLLRGKIGRREFVSRVLALGVSISGVEAILQSCGSGGSSGAPGVTTVTWTTWGNPGELDRFNKFTADFNSKHSDVKAQLIPIPDVTNYSAKILTEITSHKASDLFYAFDEDIARYIKDDWNFVWYSWVTTNGGTFYDNNGNGKFVAHQDPKAVEAFTWLADNVRAKNMIFAGTLPKGQDPGLPFMAKQVAFVDAERWYLPEFKQVSGLQYDIVPFPPNTGKPIEPTVVPVSYLVINAATKHPNEAFEFLTNFVSAAGQTFRLSGGGNAVPSIKGSDQVVLQGNNPAHAQVFLDARNIGYAIFPSESRYPGLAQDLQTVIDAIWLKGADVQTTLNKAATLANSRISPS